MVALLYSGSRIARAPTLTYIYFSGISQPTADAPSTAADAPSRPDTRNLALPLYMPSTDSSYAFLIGFMMRSPALTKPPKKMKASGEQNVAKSAQASPSILPVNWYISLAILSPLAAAIDTS